MIDADTRFHVRAYVCQRGQTVRMVEDMGTVTAVDLFTIRQSWCRYAVVETLRGQFCTIDIYEMVQDVAGRVWPAKCEVYGTLEAAVTALLTVGEV